MKKCLALLLPLGIISVIADRNVIENKDGLSDIIEPQSEGIEEFQNAPAAVESIIREENVGVDGSVAIIQIGEEVNNVAADYSILNDANSLIYDDTEPVEVNRDPEEIMDTAAGFVPIPIIRNKRKYNKQVSNRRNFRRKPYPYRRFYYYPYSFYYPGSLRFY